MSDPHGQQAKHLLDTLTAFINAAGWLSEKSSQPLSRIYLKEAELANALYGEIFSLECDRQEFADAMNCNNKEST